jgi:hypothetical protein
LTSDSSRSDGSAAGIEDRTATPVRVFISYAWEDDEYRLWVERLAVTLRTMGVDARLDIWHLEDGITIAEFMSREVRAADKVLVLCSPKYRGKVHAMEDGAKISGAGWESMLISSGLFAGSLERDRVVTALARGKWAEAAPSFLQGQVYTDLTDEAQLGRRLGDLLRRLTGKRTQAPPLGPMATNLERAPATPLLTGPIETSTLATEGPKPMASKGRFAFVVLAFAAATMLVGRAIASSRGDFAPRVLTEEFLPTILELCRTADDLETAADHYLGQPPATSEVFDEQLKDVRHALCRYNEARANLRMNHDRFEEVIRNATGSQEALAHAARSLLDNDAAEFKTFDPPDLPVELKTPERGKDELRIALARSYGSLLAAWRDNRVQLKAQLLKLRGGINRFEQELLSSASQRAPTCH